MKNDSAIYRDLYLAALLLDKDLPAFVKESSSIATSGTPAPTHYQEAWLLYNEQYPESAITFAPDSAIVARFEGYRSLQGEHEDNAIVAENLCRRKYGDTYWCYYEY